MKRITTLALATLLLLLPTTLQAQPNIDGSAAGDDQYLSLATWTQDDTGFGDHGMVELLGYSDDENLYVMIVGEAESNLNEFYFFINASTPEGVEAGNQLPASEDALSPFASFQPTNDFETDFGVRLTSGDSDNAFVGIIDYRDIETTDTFIGEIQNDGLPATFSGEFDVTTAYDDTGTLSANTGAEGWEVAISLASLGAQPDDTFELFALYGNDSFISANTLPEIPGQSGTNLGNNPDFTTIDGDQHTSASTLPVELVAFDVRLDGTAAVLMWSTASETNNAGFAVEHAAPQSAFHEVAFIAGAGTTVAAQQYRHRLDGLTSGTHRFRLRQVDFDGAMTYSPVVELTVRMTAAAALAPVYPHPVSGGTARIRLIVRETQAATVVVYDILGRRVAMLHDGPLSAGRAHTFALPTAGLVSGLYLVRAEGERFAETQRLTVVK